MEIYPPPFRCICNYKKIHKKDVRRVLGDAFEEEITRFVIDNGEKVIQFASLDDKSISSAALALKQKSISNPDIVYKMDREGKILITSSEEN